MISVEQAFRSVWAIPSWLIMRAVRPFLPLYYPLRHVKPSLIDWAHCRNETTKLFDTSMWGLVIGWTSAYVLFTVLLS